MLWATDSMDKQMKEYWVGPPTGWRATDPETTGNLQCWGRNRSFTGLNAWPEDDSLHVMYAVLYSNTFFVKLDETYRNWGFHGGVSLGYDVQPWRWRQYIPPKRSCTTTKLHGTIQKTEI
jgi:hypothetical protein